MRGCFVAVVVAVSLGTGCGGAGNLDQRRGALTGQDVDVAPECQGVLDFANVASFATLDAYLPSDVALNIIGQRSVAPYTTLAQLSSVNLVGPVRLTQLHQGALAEGFIGASCVGIFDELAVSADDQAAMVALVNSISSTELHDLLPDAWNGAVNLLGGRPYSSAAAISNMSGIGSVSFRAIRNAATLSRPFETLAAAVNGLNRDATVLRHFDWYYVVTQQTQRYLYGMTCFGVDPDLLPNGTEIRPTLASASEVYSSVSHAVSFANRYHELTLDPAVGLANLQAQLAGRSFFGCYIDYANDPWSGNNLAFFVDPVSGFSVLAETRWSE